MREEEEDNDKEKRATGIIFFWLPNTVLPLQNGANCSSWSIDHIWQILV